LDCIGIVEVNGPGEDTQVMGPDVYHAPGVAEYMGKVVGELTFIGDDGTPGSDDTNLLNT